MDNEPKRRLKNRRFRRFLVILVVVIVGLYSIPLAYLYLFQRSFVFEPSGELKSPQELGLSNVTVITETASDGTELLAWYAEPNPGQPTVLYFHGNARNVSSRSDRYEQIIDSGYGLLAPSHRGYPGSGGEPSETALVEDAKFWFDWLREQQSGPVVLHGESLGTGVAVAVAAERESDVLVLEAPYTATVDIASEQYPWLPVQHLMKDKFLSRERIASVDEPVLIVHGTDDQVIPFEHGKRLSELAGDPKRFVSVEGASHSNLWDQGLWNEVENFVDEMTAGA